MLWRKVQPGMGIGRLGSGGGGWWKQGGQERLQEGGLRIKTAELLGGSSQKQRERQAQRRDAPGVSERPRG